MFIFAKMRESNFKDRSDDELQGSYRGSHASDGDHGSCEDTSGHLREWETQEHANPEYSGGSAFRPFYWSCNHFIRPEESFLGRVFTSGFSPPVANGGTPDWMRGVLPPERTVMLSTSFGPGAGGAVCGNSSCKGRRSSSGGCCASSPGPSMVSPVARKMVRFRCHTCAEKLPTLNSLRTHLKSHSRPATLNLPVALRSDQHFVPSTVVTSKYGRRRAVVSALVAMKPGPLRR